jgi:ferric-dicitrate binding protein FerR (iron transport regulator)
MRRGDCHELELLIDREAHGWSEAERLRVEQHLDACAGCRQLLASSRFVRETLRDAQGGLPETARSRALGRAFASAAVVQKRPSVRTLGGWLGAGAAVLSAAAALLLWWSGGLNASRAPHAVLQTSPAPLEAERYVASERLAPSKQAAQQSEPSAPVWIHARARQQHRFGHASVALAAGTRVRFEEADSTLILASGRVDVDVEDNRSRPFRVTTQHFRVEVLGTRFAVTPQTVVVTRGHVQVFALDGRQLAGDLAAGSSYSYEEKAPVAPGPAASAEVWLKRAREALLRGEIQGALALVTRAEGSEPRRSDRAEAGTLRAEAALLGKQFAEAIDLYTSVSEQYTDLPAGENAAFAAAQLAARNQPARERVLLEGYLARHPHGRFAEEAKRRLQSLAKP